jgi:hypothetical protein
LTARGRAQARELATHLAGAGATALYASPLLRAVETANILSEALGLVVQTTDALREFDCGVAEGRSDAQALRLHRQLMEDWLSGRDLQAKIEGGESYAQVRDRFVPFVERLLRQPGPGSAPGSALEPALDSALESPPDSDFGPAPDSLVESGPDSLVESGLILVGHGGLYLAFLPLILANVDAPVNRRFPNAAYVLAETRPAGLVCLEWCGQPLEEMPS